LRINQQIKVKEVRLISAKGEQLGLKPTEEAIKIAEESELDLVEVAGSVNPPVCRVMNYGKYLYGQEKKKKQAKKKQKTTSLKEIKIRPKIEEHDYQVKLKSARRFLDNQDKVKVTMMFRGREMSHKELGKKILDRVVEDLGDLCHVEQPAVQEGRNMLIYLAPTTGRKVK
jgi:translation initiation factor IF-3